MLAIIYGTIHSPLATIDVISLLQNKTLGINVIKKCKFISIDEINNVITFAALAECVCVSNKKEIFNTNNLIVCISKTVIPIFMKTLSVSTTLSSSALRKRFRKENNRKLTEKNWKQFINKKTRT